MVGKLEVDPLAAFHTESKDILVLGILDFDFPVVGILEVGILEVGILVVDILVVGTTLVDTKVDILKL
jgi:hypothetical protein